MGGDVGVARRSSEGGCEPGSGGRGSGLGGQELVVAVAMFFSEAGARRRTWEASPAEHKKFVEVGVFKACDEDNKGYLSREDFKVAFVMLFGYKPSKIEADSVMSSKNSSTSGNINVNFSFSTFI
ncbi:Hypothetical predicted protein [Marmota monax]|uniref:EF-hand domain-containing protein n=1 Tax=Marmota monax TaxID=9995 RepID=A0A5E4B7G8_MARMO|nr:Hypothetical predicted protein [Marmota monax]